MEAVRKFLARKNIVFSAKRYFIDAMGAMAQGLFCTLLVGTILNTLGQQLHIGFLTEVIVTLGKGEGAVTYTIGGLCSAMVGPGMAVAIGRALEAPPLVLYSLIPVGFATNFMGGAGGPLAVLFVAIVAAELGKAVSKETKIDILVTPIVTVLVGVGFAALIAAPVGTAASAVGQAIMWATELQPFFMGILVSVINGVALTSTDINDFWIDDCFKKMQIPAGALRLDLAQYREMEVFTQFSSDLDETTKRQLIYGQGLMRLLRQAQYHPRSQHEQVILLTAGLNQFITCQGFANEAMLTTIIGAVMNIILDPIFIFTLNMGVTGAAVATIIGQFCGCALAIYFNHKKNTDITLSIKGFRPDFRLIGEIYAIGLPSVIMIAIGSVMTFLMNKILITYHAAHETAATAFGAYFKLNSFIFMPVFGLNNGVVPIVAYNYGARNRKRMVETIKRGALYASIIMAFGTVLFWVIPGPLLKIFDATDTMLSVGIPALRIISISFCMAGACIALGASFQALGRSLYSMITSIVRQLVFLIPIAYVLARYGASVGNSDLVWWSYPIAEVFSLTLTLFFFRHLYKTVIAQLPEGRE